MKLSVLAVTLAATAFLASNALAQMAPAATMQPIPNPPEKAKAHKTSHKAKHHKAAAKTTDAAPKTDDAAAAAPSK
jgi:hypothetical protein